MGMDRPGGKEAAAGEGCRGSAALASLVPDGARLVVDADRVSIAVTVVRSLADVVAAHGASREGFLEATGIAPDDLDRPDGRIAYAEFNRIRELALDMTGQEDLGLRWAASTTDRSLVPISHLVAHCASLRQALQLLARYIHVVSDGRAYDVLVRGDHVVLRYLPLAGESQRMTRCTAEMLVGGFWSFVECFAGGRALGPVRFAYPAPPHRAEYVRYFGDNVLFEQPHTELEFPADLLDAPSPQRDDELRDTIRDLVEQRLNRMMHATPWSQRVRELLVREWQPQRTDMDTAARGLGVSARTLRRRLADEGTHYEDVLAAARCAIAKQLLRDPQRPIAEVAYTLGFSDSSTFHRAFKRWTGTTPKRFRSSQLAASS